MNLERLKAAEAEFLARYPGGFADPEMEPIAKKHRVDKMTEQTQELLARKNFANRGPALDSVVKIVSRSSMISMFEKPRFRDYVNGLGAEDREDLAAGFKTLLHGNRERGFNQVLDVLSDGKLAKWSLMTICLYYMHPQTEVFVKPTTTKRAIEFFELEGLEYRPRPSWQFYTGYRDAILEIKSRVDPSLAPNNAAFTGFLMVSMGLR